MVRPGRQQRPVHELRAPAHRVAGQHVLGDCMLHEAIGREHLHLARLHVGLVDHALDAAEVVDVAVAVDHRHDRALGAVGEVEIERGLRGLGRDQRVDQDQAGGALDDGQVRQVHAAHLVDAVADLEEAVDGVELRLAPEARVHRVGRLRVLQEGVALHRPGRPRRVAARHGRIGHGGDEAAMRIVEVAAVGPGQRGQQRLVGSACGGLGGAAVLGVCGGGEQCQDDRDGAGHGHGRLS